MINLQEQIEDVVAKLDILITGKGCHVDLSDTRDPGPVDHLIMLLLTCLLLIAFSISSNKRTSKIEFFKYFWTHRNLKINFP